MKPSNTYRKNYILIVSFIALISLSLIIALFSGYKFTQKFIENQFYADKTNVLDKSLKPYNEFIFEKLPQVSLYQGFLDSSSIIKYSTRVFNNYSFIDSLVFYDVEVSNQNINDGFKAGTFAVGVKGVYGLRKEFPNQLRTIFRKSEVGNFSIGKVSEFSKSLFKFIGFISENPLENSPNSDLIYKTFYTFTNNSVSYLNVPRLKELRIFKDLMTKPLPPSPYYDQDVITFFLNPFALEIQNEKKELFQTILIKPVSFDSLSTDKAYLTTGIAMPGAFSDYQLYFISSKEFINIRAWHAFMPFAIVIIGIYLLLLLCAYLIYRNLNINSKMFKLQYDFINNLTHEFKTPVSVIKIAGNNLRTSDDITEKERHLYGKILDEEADKLNNLMNKLLSLTQLENKSIEIRKETIFLAEFCESIIDEYSLKYPDFKIAYSIEGIDHFESDITLLSSIFVNLIDNAYKYSPPEKKVLDIRIRKFRKNLVMQFIDQGIGIPSAELENIFRKFYRIENEFNQQGSAGIGLAFCKELVNFMKGEISVKSKAGKGSEFKIMLPIDI